MTIIVDRIESHTSSVLGDAVVWVRMLHPDAHAKQNFEFENPTEIGSSLELDHGEADRPVPGSHPVEVGDWSTQPGEYVMQFLF